MDKYTGKRLDGRYEIHELLGMGGMAVVYRAYDTIDDRTVAIKILKDEFLGNDEFIRRFKNESKAIAILSHPNIVKVYDVSFGDQIQYIVMEYIDGITLKEYLDQQKEIKWKEAIHFTVQILRALQHAHEKGIVHRDIKPQNIMLLQDGTIKVTDFGIARFSRNETRTMTDKAIGSVHYISPEQARGDLTDEKADIYSVGVMLYEMITGRLPFEADNAVSVAIMQLQSDPKPPKEINPAIPDGLEEITLKAMQKNPAQRYQSAAEMLRDIEQFRRNPSIRFQYKYFIDEKPTKYVDAINSVKGYDKSNTNSYNDNYEYVEEDIKPKKKKSTATVAVAGVVVAFVIIAVIFGIMAIMRSCQSTTPTDITLPNFVGMKLADVQSNKDYNTNFTFKIEYSTDTTKDAGIVLKQSPEGNKKVKVKSEVTLTVNQGSKQVKVPDVIGKSEDDAIAAIKAANLVPNRKQAYNSQTVAGYVFDTDPKKGTSVAEGSTTVTIYVSLGTDNENIKVPQGLIGASVDNAKATILAAGLTVNSNIVKQPSDQPVGTVITTDPLPGVSVAKGSAVTLTVSSGKSQKTITVYVELPITVTHPVKFTAYLDGSQIKSETVIPSDKRIYNLDVAGTSGTHKLEVRLDDQPYKEWKIDFDAPNGNPVQTNSHTYVDPQSQSSSTGSGSGPSGPSQGH
ncbi:MAG TPA: Stk1 family PASTA domain-containing Ser/Thr kinase [Oscillospiraceae bacterium]|nr:Stk1 family PASTA domain-containing Ser/Thr kinase [Oscillospiraceae bacterium]